MCSVHSSDAPDLPAHLLIVNIIIQLADLCQQLGVLVGGFFLRRLLFFHALESIGIQEELAGGHIDVGVLAQIAAVNELLNIIAGLGIAVPQGIRQLADVKHGLLADHVQHPPQPLALPGAGTAPRPNKRHRCQ